MTLTFSLKTRVFDLTSRALFSLAFNIFHLEHLSLYSPVCALLKYGIVYWKRVTLCAWRDFKSLGVENDPVGTKTAVTEAK